MNEIERIQQAIQRARQAQDAEAVAELEGLLAQARTQSALQAEEFNRQQGFELKPMSEREITRNREQYFANQAKELEEQGPSQVARKAEVAGTGALSGAVQAGGFLQGVIDPLANAVEWAESKIAYDFNTGEWGREPRYRNRFAEAQQTSNQLISELGELSTGDQVALGVGQAVPMIAEVAATGGSRAVPRVGEALWDAASRSWVRGTANTVTEAVPAVGVLAPRLGAQTAYEAEQAGATPSQALAAGAVDTLATIATAGLPLSQTGGVIRRGVTGAIGGIGAEAGTAGVVNPLLPEELAAQRDLTNPDNLTTSAALGSGMAVIFGTRAPLTRAQRVEQQRLAQIAAADETGKVAEGAAVVAQAEESARKGTVTESPLGPVRQEPVGPSSPFLPRAEGVDLETPRAEASTLLTPAEESIGLPRGPVSVLPGQEPSTALGLGTPRGEAIPLTENPVQQARAQELTQERDALFQKGAPLTRKEKSRVKTINKELNTIAAEQASFAQRAPVDRLARTALPGSVEPTLTPPAPTPLPTTRASRVEAPTQPTAAPIVREDVIDLETGKVTGEQTAEVGVPVNDTQRRQLEDFFNNVKANRSVNLPSDQQAAFARIMNVQVPPEQRKATPLRQALSRATTAWDALAGVKAAVRMGADPKIERYDRLIDSLTTEDMKNVGFTLLQPETEARTPFQERLKNDPKELQTKGVHEVDPATGRDEVTIVGDGYARRDGTATVETTLHEIVHAKTAAAIRAVRERRETDPAIVQAVRDLEAVRSSLEKSIPKSGLTTDEKSAVSYAVSNTDEFVTGVMTNPLVQSALKKENLWDKVRNIIRALLRIPRSQKSLLDEVLDASYSLVDAINKRDAGTRVEATTPDTGARRATVQPTRASRVNEAREQSIGKPTKLRPMPRTDLGRRLDRVGRFLHDWLSANKRGTDETTEAFSKAQGTIQRAHAELQPVGLKLDRLLSGISRRRSDAKAELATKYLSTNDAKAKASIADKLKYPELVQTLDRARAIMDRVSTDVGREIVKAYEGRTMPESVTNLLQTIKKNLGQYTARVYLADIEDGYASRLWESYKKGDPAAREQLQPLVDKVDGQLNNLASWIQGAKDEAALLSDDRVDFNATDTILGKEVRNRYSNFLGNPGNKPLKELFKELEAFSASVEKSDLAQERDRAVQKLIGVFDDAAQGDALVQYARAMRSDEKATLRRQNVPPELRKAWGEIVDPILLFNVTTARAVAAMANLRSSNYLMDNAPNLFSTREEPETNKMARIPNNPSVYGKMAGMYTIPAVHDAVVAQTAMLGAKGVGNDVTGWLSDGFQKVLQGARTVTRWTKLTQIVTNVFNGTILNSLNLVYMPLINGNISPARLKDAFLATQSLVATAYRTGDPHPRALELLDEGVIDPVQLSTDEEVRARTREARLIEQGAGATRTAARQVLDAGFTNPLNTLKEVVNFFELLPKAWNYYNAKDEFRAAFPDLSEAEIRNLAAEQTNQMNPTYARTRMAVQATETTMVSYTANYMEQIATNTAMAIKVGYTQAANGIRTGNKQLAFMGIKKLMGVSGAMGASYMLPSIVGAAMGIVEDDEDQIIAENLPFIESGMQPVIVGVDGDRVVFMDAGRANPGDTVHAPLRAFISAIANIEDGNTEEATRDLEGGVNNLKGQFFGGSMLGTIALSLIQDRRTGQQLERGLPEVYTWLAENAPAPAATTNIANAAYSALVPAQVKGVAESYTRRQKQGDEFNWDTREVLTALRAPVRDASMIDSVSTSARTFQEARRSPSSDLRQVILAPGDISDERFNQLVEDLIESQQEPYNEMLRSLEGIRALGRKQNLSSSETDKMLREGLKAGNIAARDMDAILRGEPFKPKQLSDTFLEDAIANRVRSEQVRQERARLQTLYESRVERVKEIMDDRIKNYNQ